MKLLSLIIHKFMLIEENSLWQIFSDPDPAYLGNVDPDPGRKYLPVRVYT